MKRNSSKASNTIYFDKIIFLCTIFGGWFGLHRYLRGQIGLGIIYTLTMGLFCIGWIVDIIVEATRVSVGNLISGETTKKSKKKSKDFQTENIIIAKLNNDLRIMNESAQIMQSTSSPDIFFSRYNLYIEKLYVLADAEKSGISFEGDSPTKKLKEISTEEEKTKLTNSMIDRFWKKTEEKISRLKTETGKDNHIIKFQKELSNHDSNMTVESIAYYKSKI